ncbi:MAG: hypothetical protein WA012_09135, partial [Rhodoferax sp.]|uniref:hypothetical protein n=1 Tax=Rhodoferax sp. TaxID=50421 RepID=UPI003BB4BC53
VGDRAEDLSRKLKVLGTELKICQSKVLGTEQICCANLGLSRKLKVLGTEQICCANLGLSRKVSGI